MTRPTSIARLLRLTLCASVLACLLPSVTNSAAAQYRVTHLEQPVNSAGSETGALRLGDTVLVYASMPPDVSKGSTFDYSDAVMQLQQTRIAKSGKTARPRPCRWGFNHKRDHTGNLAIDPVSRDAYFTRGDVETLRCDIWWAPAKKRRGWEKARRLEGAVNHKQHTATHPAVGRLDDGTTILYFVSDRPGGMGGMDIWYALVDDGVASDPVNLGPQVNSADDEMTPFYDQRNGTLYFSSDRAGGQGGFDIYCAVGQRNTWQPAEAVCHCLNSEQNDLYFTISDHDASTGIPTAGYLSSNRKDSYFLSDSMCCNDIYRWTIDSAVLLAMQPQPDTMAVVPEAPRRRTYSFVPLALYFHNDEPDPRSTDTATQADYADCQLRYALMRSEYMAHQHTSADSAAMQLFFDSCVVGNFERVGELLDHVAEALAEGRQVALTVAGYASPVFRDDYNHVLSQRRIGALTNMIRAWRHGLLASALSDGRLRIEQEPMGADTTLPAFTAPRSPDPVFSIEAARARRIEVRSCKIF